MTKIKVHFIEIIFYRKLMELFFIANSTAIPFIHFQKKKISPAEFYLILGKKHYRKGLEVVIKNFLQYRAFLNKQINTNGWR
jgi:hypothetical protein